MWDYFYFDCVFKKFFSSLCCLWCFFLCKFSDFIPMPSYSLFRALHFSVYFLSFFYWYSLQYYLWFSYSLLLFPVSLFCKWPLKLKKEEFFFFFSCLIFNKAWFRLSLVRLASFLTIEEEEDELSSLATCLT